MAKINNNETIPIIYFTEFRMVNKVEIQSNIVNNC